MADLCADALELMKRALLLAHERQEYDPVSRYCPPEIRYDYRGT